LQDTDPEMSFYRERIYPHLVSALGNPKPIAKIRERIVPWAKGSVLEIGVGPGVNFVYYDPAKVNKVYALEPNPGMLRRAEEQPPADAPKYRVCRSARGTHSTVGRER
jgi:predicted RNA methylase